MKVLVSHEKDCEENTQMTLMTGNVYRLRSAPSAHKALHLCVKVNNMLALINLHTGLPYEDLNLADSVESRYWENVTDTVFLSSTETPATRPPLDLDRLRQEIFGIS